MTRRTVLTLLVPFLILTLAAPAAGQAPKRGGTVRIAEREAPSLDPHLSISFLTHSHVNMALAIDRKGWNEGLLYGEGCIDTGPVPCAMKEWKLEALKLEPARAKYLTGFDPAEARKLLAEAGYPDGFATPAYHWQGYQPPWRSYYDLAARTSARSAIKVELKPEEYGKYISTTYLGKFEKMAIGP